MWEYLCACRRTVILVIRSSPVMFIFMGIMVLVEALLPAAQVSLLRSLTDALVAASSASANFKNLLPLTIAVIVILGLGTIAGDASHLLKQIVSSNGAAAGRDIVNKAATCYRPQDISTSRFATQARLARDAAARSFDWQFIAVTGTIGGTLSMTFLFAALWDISPAAALLILSSLLVGLPFKSKSAKIDGLAFPRIAEERKFAEYFTDLLTYQSTALDLSALHGQRKIVSMAKKRLYAAAAVFQRTLLKMTGLNALGAVVTMCFVGCALWIVIADTSATAGNVVGGVMALLASQSAMSSLAESIGLVLAETAPVIHMYRFIDSSDGVGAAKNSDLAFRFTPVNTMSAKNVCFTYEGADSYALKNCSITIKKGELIALVGLNGAGKTTLVNCLSGAYIPSSGSVEVDGVALNRSNRDNWRAEIAFMSQDFSRFELTVREAVTLGCCDPVTETQIWEALDKASLAEHISSFADGLDTQLGQQFGGVGMSGGQWQRLALARMFLRNLPVLILDEPTSAVDAATEENILKNLRMDKEQRITIVVSHRAWTLRNMDRIYVIDDGAVVESGTYDELVARGGVFTNLFKLQVAEEKTAAKNTSSQ